MLKYTISSLLLASTLLANTNTKQEANQQFQILANNIDTKTNIITASGEVVAYSSDYYLVADKIIYNKEKEEIELFDNVMIVKNNTIQTQSNYAKLNIKTNDIYQNPTVLFDKSTNIWLNANITSKQNNTVDLDTTTISSCNCNSPFWSIKSSSADYDTEDKWLNTYNTRLYIKDVPVLYTPYLGFSTDTTRRTGLLYPSLGYSDEEGLFYSQPIYFAPADNYDLEFIPQIRSNRGVGIYVNYRLVDSEYSSLDFKTGIFKEKSDYYNDNDLKNNKHFGWNLNYTRTKLFSNEDNQDGLYLDINSLNDVEYITLENDEETISTDKKVESKLNYFFNTNSYYYGLYGKYYIDTSINSNDSTLQELPQLQMHKYVSESFVDNLTYSFDFQSMNYTRDEGINAVINNLSVPLVYSKDFLNDYLYFTLKNNTVISKYNYDNSTLDIQNGELIQNETTIGLGTNLIKPYQDYLHTISFDATYLYPKLVHKDGDLYRVTTVENSALENELSPFPVTQTDKLIKLKLNQSLFDKEDLQEIINHSLTQSVVYNTLDEAKFDDLVNYTKINFENGFISNKVTYNFQDDKFVENSISINYRIDNFDINLAYYNSKDSENSNREDLESYSASVYYRFNKYYKLSYYTNYNLKENIRNKQGISFNINENCWDFNIKLEKEIIPTTTDNNLTTAVQQNVVYFQLQLKPLGGIKQKYVSQQDK